MRWLEGQRKAVAVLYVEGANDGQMLCRPSGLAGKLVSVVSRDPEGSDAKQSGRYSIKDFGVQKAAQRTLAAWKAAQDQGTLRVEYLGVRKVRELGDRPCHTFHRTYVRPEEDGVLDGKFYIDTEKLIQIGTVLKGKDGLLHGEYFFRDIQFNPEFKPDQFQRAALTP
jgi:outer membrane lipoprotein-sorting protein